MLYVLENVNVETNPQFICFFNDYIFVSNQGSNTVSVLNSSYTVINTIPVGNGPQGIISNNNYVFVANTNSNTISVIDITLTVINTINLGVNASPFQLAIDNNYLWCSSPGINGISRISLTDFSVLNNSNIGTLTFSIASTGVKVYYATFTSPARIYQFDISNNIVESSLNKGAFIIFLKNNYLYGTIGNTLNKIDLASFTFTNSTNFPGPGNIIGIGGDNDYLYVGNQGDGILYQCDYNLNLLNQITVGIGSGSGTFGLALKSNILVAANASINNVSIVSTNYIPRLPCFKEGIKILTDQGYKPIEQLKKGDLVQTLKHGFLPIELIGKREMVHSASPDRIKNQLYLYSKNEETIFEDLILTGCHSILVDCLTQEQGEKTMEDFNNIYETDNKVRLCAYIDNRASIYEIPGNYTIYHLALENENYTGNYGIYANGLLVESCSKRYLMELSNMDLIGGT